MLRLVGLVRPLAPWMALAVVLGVLGFGAAIFLTVFGVYALVDLAGFPQTVGYGAALALVAVCGVARGPLRYGEQLCNHYLAFKLLALVRDRVFAALRRLAPAKLEGRDKGDLVSLVTGDIELLEVFDHRVRCVCGHDGVRRDDISGAGVAGSCILPAGGRSGAVRLLEGQRHGRARAAGGAGRYERVRA